MKIIGIFFFVNITGTLTEEMNAVIVKLKKKIYLVVSLPLCLSITNAVNLHFKENILT